MEEIVATQTLIKARSEGMGLLSPLKSEVLSLEIQDEEGYQMADILLSRVMTARKTWLGRINPIVKPIYDSLQLLYALRGDFDDPMKEYEAAIKGKMKTYKLEEARQLRIAEDARLKKIDDDRRAAEEKQAKADAAKTKGMKQKLETQAAALIQNAEILEVGGPAQGATATHSTVRSKKKAEVTDLVALLKGIIAGKVPDDLISINQVELNSAYRIDAEEVASWPGITIVDDINISGRRT
jgi:hypothetical protein